MEKKNVTPKQQNPVIRKTSITRPELYEEQLTGGLGDQGATALSSNLFDNCHSAEWCSYDGDEA